jgi:hypothetical protein
MRIFLYKILIWFTVFTFNLQSVDLNAQDPELFNHTWYFNNGELNGDPFLPTENLTAELYFYSDYIDVGYPYCEGGISFEDILYDGGNTFEILGDSPFLIDLCVFPDDENELTFMNKHNLLYSDYQNTGIANNPFTYTITTVNNYFQLTIENDEGDWAVYNSVLLSTASFDQNSFALYPNPVKETLQINNSSNQRMSATIYDINGKKLQTQSLETSTSTIDVKSLNPGLYFLVFESETGERVSRKFVKR